MKIALIGHSASEKRQLLFIKKLSKYFDISLHIPKVKNNTDLISSKIKIFKYHTFFSNRQQIYFLPGLCKKLKKEKPNLLLIWEEPWYFISQQINLCYNGKIIYFVFENLLKPKNPVFKLIEKISFKKIKFLVCASDTSQKAYKIKGYKGKTFVFPMVGIDTKIFRKYNKNLKEKLRKKYKLKDKKVILFAGRLVKSKGIDYLLRSFLDVSKNSKKYLLLFVGDGPERKNIENFSKKHNIQEKILILGKKDYFEMPEIYNLADIFVYPSITTKKWAEQFGYSMIEAAACGVPVISTKSGSIPDILKVGLLVPERNSKELGKAIIMLFKNKKLYRKMSKNGIKFAKKFDNDVIVKKYLNLIKNAEI